MQKLTLQRIQRISGLVFLVFLIIHLGNTYAALLGPEIYDAYQRFMRAWYQQPLIEILAVLAPLVVHLACGVVRIRESRFKARELPLRRRLHRYSGIFLAVAVFGHIAATRSASLLGGINPGFEGMAFTIQWVPGYFYPYYFLFGASAAYHAWHGALSIFRSPIAVHHSPRTGYWIPPVIGATLVGIALLAFGGVFFAVDDAMSSDYARFILSLLP